MKIRKPAVAGMFYPEDREELKSMTDGFLGKAPDVKIDGNIKALIVPHAGYIYSGQVAAHAYSFLKKYQNKKIKIVLLGPSHNVYFNDVASDANDYWETPLGKAKVLENNFMKAEAAHSNEHCLEVQIPFLQGILNSFEILPLIAGDTNPREISKKIQKILDDNTLLVISSDLSHFNSYETAIKIDKNTINAIQNLDYAKMEAIGDACGKIPILAAIDIANQLKWKCKLLDYKNSGDTAGDKSRVVGYASFVLYE